MQFDGCMGNLSSIISRAKAFSKSEDVLARVFRNSAWMTSAKGLGGIASLFYLAVLTRSLGPAGFGQFILIVSTIQILSAFVRLQTWQTVVQYGTKLIHQGDKGAFSRLVWEEAGVEMLGSILALLVLFYAFEPIAYGWGWNAQTVKDVELYGLIVFLSARSTTTGILRASDNFRDVALGDAAIPLVRLIGVVILLFTESNVHNFLIIWGLSETASALVQIFWVWRRGLVGRPGSKAAQPGYWAFLFATNASYILTVIKERGAVLLVGIFVGDAAAGVFRLADQIANSLNRVAEIFSRPLYTEMSRLYALNDFDRCRELFSRSLRLSCKTGAVVLVALLALGYPVIYLMSGQKFLAAYPMLLVLGASTIIGLASLGLEPFLQAADRSGIAFILRLGGIIITVALMALFLERYGAMGGCWAILVGSIFTLALSMVAAFREIRHMEQRTHAEVNNGV